MKNDKTMLWWVLGIICMTASLSSAVLVDDLEGYDTSASTNMRDIALDYWTPVNLNTGYADIFTESGNGNQYFSYGWYQTTSSNNRGAFRSIPAVDNTSTATLFCRIYAQVNSLNHSFGLADEDPSVPDPQDSSFEIELHVNPGLLSDQFSLVVNNGGTNVTIADTLSRNTWYNVWVVFDQTTDTYDVYVTTDDKLIPTLADQLATGVAFKNGTPDDVDIFYAISPNAGQNFRIDDIHLTYGVALFNPKLIVEGANNPTPSSLTANIPFDADLTLQWAPGMVPDSVDPNIILANPAITSHYLTLSVPFSTDTIDPNWSNPASILATYTIGADINPVDGNVDAISQQVIPAALLTADSIHFWKVDEYLNGQVPVSTDPNVVIAGNTWSFQTDTVAPDVEAGMSIVTWLENGSKTINLDGTVGYTSPAVEDYTLWSVYKTPSVDPIDPNVTIGDANLIDTTATFTSTGEFILELYAKDTTGADAFDRVVVSIFDDSCEAAQNDPNNPAFAFSAYDLNQDCVVNLSDFSLFASGWLEDQNAGGDIEYIANIISAPTIIITSPVDGATVSGTVTLTATIYDEYVGITDGAGIAEVFIGVYEGTDASSANRVWVDGVSDYNAPYTYDWNTPAFADGVYTIRFGSQSYYFAAEQITVTVDNTP